MKLNKMMFAMGLGMTVISGGAMAGNDASTTTTTDQTHVYFDGSITNVPCSMPDSSRDQKVHLGSIASHVLENGGTSDEIPFSFDLKDCPAGNTVTVTFTGTSDEGQDNLITLGSGTATGAGIQILADGEPVKLGTATAPKTLAKGDNVLTYDVQLKGYGKDVTTGDFNAVSNVMFTYN